MRVLQGDGPGAFQDDTRDQPRTERVDLERAGCEDEIATAAATGPSDIIPRGRATLRAFPEVLTGRAVLREVSGLY
jgi:hypothetical protein